MADIASVQLKVGLEVHVELATRTKMFTRVPSPAHPDFYDAAPNTLIDPVVLGLPGALPVLNKQAIEMAMLVGLALGCRVAEFTKWDRKSYYYPDLPKNYQISQYDLPICYDGAVDLPLLNDKGEETTKRVGIVRAHLEEDAGKLLHELPGGHAIDHSIVDFNRAGTPLLEIVSQPDFAAADEVVAYGQWLRNVCRFLGVSEGVMQKGHMRFEPNINTIITLSDGRTVKTPIVEIKNLNSFKALKGAIEYELEEQPARWGRDGKVMGPGAKSTRGWDDEKGVTVLQREKEDAHDYRYFPDPDLTPVRIGPAWLDGVRKRLPELPHVKKRRYMDEYTLGAKEAAALTDERDVCLFYERTIAAVREIEPRITEQRAGKAAANMILQSGAKRANERGVMAHELGIAERQIAQIIALRESDQIGSSAADELFGLLCDDRRDALDVAKERNLLQVRDEGALEAWCTQAIADPANEKSVADVKGGKIAAIGRLTGAVMKLSGGAADAKAVQAKLKELLGA